MATVSGANADGVTMTTLDSKCPRCKVNFKLTERKQHVCHKREPLLLSCGHAVCQTCFGPGSHTCVVCQTVTVFHKKFYSKKHLYIVGSLYQNRNSGNLKMNIHFSKQYQQPKQTSKGQCQECCQTKATVLCTTCMSQLCDGCFKKIHIPRIMKNHKFQPLTEGGLWHITKCPDHPQDLCSMLCQTCSSADSEKYICTRCHIIGSHQQHEIIELEYLNSLQMPQVEAALSEVENFVKALQFQKNRCLVLIDDLNKAQQVATQETQDIANRLHGLLQLREEEATAMLHVTARTLIGDLARKEAELEKEIDEHMEVVKEARAALNCGKEMCHTGKLLKDLRELLQGAEADGESNSQEETQHHQQKEEEEEGDNKKYSRSDSLDEIAEKIAATFDMTSVMKNILEQFSLPPVSLLVDNSKDCSQFMSGTPGEVISDGYLTPAHLQICASPRDPDTLPKLHQPNTVLQGTLGSSTLPLIGETELSLMPKLQSPSSLPLETERSLAHSPGVQECYNLVLEPEKDLSFKSQNDTAFLAEGTEKDNNSNTTNNISMHLMTDTIYGMQTSVNSSKTLKKPIFSPTVMTSNTDHDSDGFHNNAMNMTDMVNEKLKSYKERFSTLCNSLTLQTSASPPSDTNNDETLQLVTSDSSSTNYLAAGCTTEDSARETVTPDLILNRDGWQARGTVPQDDAEFKNEMDLNFYKTTPPPPLQSRVGAAASRVLDFSDFRPIASSQQSSSRSNRTSRHFSTNSNRNSLVSVKTSSYIVEEEVEVTHIISPSFFYVHVKDNFQKRETLSKKLRQLAVKSKPITTPPVEGSLYIGQFNEDKKWYRVLVKTVMMEEESALVSYVDYGNKEVLPFARMYHCPAKHWLENQPSLALACSLWEVEPAKGNDWDTEAIHIFAKLVKDVALQFLLVSYETVNNITKCQVDLRRPWRTVGIANDLPVSIREILVFLEHGVYTNNSPQDMYKKKREESFKRRYFLPEIPFCEMETEVVISSVTSPHNFNLQLVSFSEHLISLLDDLKKTYSHPEMMNNVEWKIYSPKIGMPCVAQYSGDGRWQRARVEDLPGHQMVDVKFIDYGNIERLWYSQIYKIMDDFLVLPIQAIKCKLVGINPIEGQWTEKDTQRMAELCENPELKAVFLTCDGDTCSVHLTVSIDAEDVDVVQLLVEDGVGVPLLSYSGREARSHSLRRQRMTFKDSNKGPSLLQPILLDHAWETRLKVAHVKVLEPFVYLHVLLSHRVPDFNQFQEQLEETMESEASCSTFAPSVGDKCVVIRRNRQYARARILSVREGQAEVLLLDCGGIEEASVANLCQLPEGKVSTTDPFYQIVNLVGVLPPGGLKVWPGVTLDYLKNHFSSYKKFFIAPEGEPTWDEKLQMKVQPVDLGWMHEKMGGPMEPNKITWVSTNKELISCGLGLPVRLSSPFKKATVENDKKLHIDLVCSSDCKKGEEDSLSTEKSEDTESETSLLSDVMIPTSIATKVPKGWMVPPSPVDLAFIATPCYVDDEGHFFLQPKSMKATIDLVMESQTLLFAGSIPGDQDLCWQPGDPVVARYHLDKKWYRATVDKLEKNGEVKVTFVDYGNSESVKVREIRTRLLHTNIPILCYKAELNNVVPASEDGQWSIKLLDFMHRTIVDKECLVTLIEPPVMGQVLKVNLKLLSTDLDVTSFLVDELGACKRISPHKEEEQSSHDVIIESEDSEASSKFSQFVPTPQLYLPEGEMFCVQVTAVQNPAHVFLMPLTSQELPSTAYHKAWSAQCSNLKKFLKHVNKDPRDLKVMSDPKVGKVCLVQFNEEMWVRAEVEEVDASTASLLYIDFGHREKVSKENIYECPVEGKKIARCARLVRLSGVEPPGGPQAEWEAVAMEAMIACLMNPKEQRFLASVLDVVGDLAEVELFKMNSTQSFILAYTKPVEKGIITLRQKKSLEAQ